MRHYTSVNSYLTFIEKNRCPRKELVKIIDILHNVFTIIMSGKIVTNGKIKMRNNTQIRREYVTTIADIVSETPNNTNIFTNTNLELVFIISNTMDHNLRKKAINTNKYEKSGMCYWHYNIYGTSRKHLKTRHKELMRDITENRENFVFIQKITDTGTTWGKIYDSVDAIHLCDSTLIRYCWYQLQYSWKSHTTRM